MSDSITTLNAALVGRYRIEREVGEGGMATVYLAEEVRHHRAVALKVLHPDLVSALGATRFEREIGIAANLRHPNILPLLDSGSADGFLFYAMPFIEDGSLRERIQRQRQLPIVEAVAIAAEVASALAHSHDRGVIHRDIKPSNIMMDHGRPTVSDYGIALVVQSVGTDRITESGFSPGSPEYMSPEQAAGEGTIDARSDIYSLGCVLYELLTGEPPFTGKLPQAILAKKLLSAAPDPRVVRDSIPDHVADAIAMALAKSPADRFQTADELGRALVDPVPPAAWSPPLEADALPPLAVRRRPSRLSSLGRSPGAVGLLLTAVAVTLTTIGFFSTLAYDVALGIPAEYTPSRTDFPIVGARALVQPLFWVFVLATGYVVGRHALQAAAYGAVRVPGLGRSLESWGHRTAEAVRSIGRPRDASTLAEVYFIGAVVIGLIALRLLWPLLDVFTAPYDTSVMAPEFGSLHHGYSFLLTALVVGIAIGWHRVFHVWLRGRQAGARVTLARWGSLAWIAILVVVMTWPWRLLWDNNHPRALLDGAPAYILLENEAEVVVYMPLTRATQRHPKDDSVALERLGTIGYLFEGTEPFERSGSE